MPSKWSYWCSGSRLCHLEAEVFKVLLETQEVASAITVYNVIAEAARGQQEGSQRVGVGGRLYALRVLLWMPARQTKDNQTIRYQTQACPLISVANRAYIQLKACMPHRPIRRIGLFADFVLHMSSKA
jgi:hypothetical protein